MPTDNLKKWTEDPNYKKPGYGKEIPQTKKFKSDLDAWLTGNVVEPMANAGYPNLGAGIATVPSTLAEFLLPENTAELAPGMAGVGKMSRKAKKMSKELLDYAENNPGKIDMILDWLYNSNPEKIPAILEKSDLKSRMAAGKLNELKKFVEGKKNNDLEHRLNKDNWPINFDVTNKKLNKDIKSFKQLKDFSRLAEDSSIGKSFKQIIDDSNYNKNFESKRIDLAHKAVFGDKPYLRPKGYAKQPKMVKPELPQSPIQTREQYDEMLRGKNPGQEYFSGMTDEFNNAQMKEDDFDLIKQLIDKSWKAK